MKISAVVITRDEERNIAGALESLAGVASEIVVVDSGSTDRTVKIAREYTDRVVERAWTGYASQKNFANGLAAHPWILSLDADERLSPDLRAEILAMLPDDPACSAFSMPRRVFYLGRWIGHSGWYPDRKVRLFRKDRARWEGDYVHETLAVSEPVTALRGDIHHLTYRSIAEHLARINHFSDLGAQKLYAAKKKCRVRHLAVLPASRFLKSYVLKRGFLDGFPGLVISVFNAYAIFVRYAKLREIWKKGERLEPFPN